MAGLRDTAISIRNAGRAVIRKMFPSFIANQIANTGPIGDANEIFNKGARGFFGMISPIQSRQELVPLLELLQSTKPKTIMEIGTANGGTLFMLTRVVQADGMIISLDLPGGDFGDGYGEDRKALFESFALPNQTMKLIRNDSHLAESLDHVKAILGDTKIDFLLIDGDHTYEGVKQDFEMYSPLVSDRGIIAFHDIVYVDDVGRYWSEEIKPKFSDTREFIATSGVQYGIGVAMKASYRG